MCYPSPAPPCRKSAFLWIFVPPIFRCSRASSGQCAGQSLNTNPFGYFPSALPRPKSPFHVPSMDADLLDVAQKPSSIRHGLEPNRHQSKLAHVAVAASQVFSDYNKAGVHGKSDRRHRFPQFSACKETAPETLHPALGRSEYHPLRNGAPPSEKIHRKH